MGYITEQALVDVIQPLLAAVSIGYEPHAVAVVVALGISTALHVVAGEVAPKNFAIYYPNRLLLILAPPLIAFTYLFYPFIWILNTASNSLLRLVGVKVDHAHHEQLPHNLKELRALVQQSIKGGEVTGTAEEILSSVFDFGDLKTRQIMTPRPQVDYLLVGQPIAEVLERVKNSGWSRLPLSEGAVDNVVGVIHVKDLFKQLEPLPPATGQSARAAVSISVPDLKAIAREILIVPEMLPVTQLLARFQARRVHMAAAIDEYGALAGIVTLEDVIEELVGDIEDEFDAAPSSRVRQEGEVLRVPGSFPIHDLVNELELGEFDTLNVDTVNGYFLEKLGRFPRVGDELEFGRYRGRVASVVKLRAGEVVFRPANTPHQGEAP